MTKVDSVDIGNPVLRILQAARHPVTLEYIRKRVKKAVGREFSDKLLLGWLEDLSTDGYDVKEVTHGRLKQYSLVRWGDYSETQSYKPLGRVKLPLLLCSDLHIGSKGFSPVAFKQLSKDVLEYGVEDALIVGDLLQGRGVHRLELSDLLVPEMDGQLDLADELLGGVDVRWHITDGNHEEKLRGNVMVGWNALRSLSMRCDNVSYYGSVAKLEFGRGKSVLMMHTRGGIAYAVSYRPQRIFNELVEKPSVLATGHTHQLLVLPKPPNHLMCICGTLQRESAYLLWRGITAQVGWIILEEYRDDKSRCTVRNPKVY